MRIICSTPIRHEWQGEYQADDYSIETTSEQVVFLPGRDYPTSKDLPLLALRMTPEETLELIDRLLKGVAQVRVKQPAKPVQPKPSKLQLVESAERLGGQLDLFA